MSKQLHGFILATLVALGSALPALAAYRAEVVPIAAGGTGATTLAGANIALTNTANTFSSAQTFSSTISVATSATIGSGTPITKIVVYSQSLSPSAVAANTTAEQTFTVTGLATNDNVFVNKPTAQAGLGIVGMRVSATNTLAITFSNNTAGSITPTASETYQIVAIRS